MKKSLIFTMGLFFAILAITACGDGGADEARQKAIADSLRNDSLMKVADAREQARLDSLAAVALADSARAQAVRDSIAMAQASKSGTKRTTTKTTTTTPTSTSTTTTTTTTKPPLTGKDAIKGGTGTPTGKDAIKNAGGTDTKKPSGKDAIKGK